MILTFGRMYDDPGDLVAATFIILIYYPKGVLHGKIIWLSQRKGGMKYPIFPPDKWYRCGCYLLDGFDSSLPQRASFDVLVHESSSSLPRAASEERENPRCATRVYGPLVVVDFAAS